MRASEIPLSHSFHVLHIEDSCIYRYLYKHTSYNRLVYTHREKKLLMLQVVESNNNKKKT